MKKALFVCLFLGALALLFAQQQRRPTGAAPGRVATGGSPQAPVYAPYELLSVFPEETSPGEYHQVEPSQLQRLADQGWQLVSVTPDIYINEQHGGGTSAPLVTQVYQAYFFQRSRLMR